MKNILCRIFELLTLTSISHAAVLSLRGHEQLDATSELVAPRTDNSTSAEDTPVDKLREDARETVRKASNMHPHRMLEADLKLYASYLFPGRKPDFYKKRWELLLALLGILWFIPFKIFFYVNDQQQQLDHELQREKARSEGVKDEEGQEDACDNCWRSRVQGLTEDIKSPEPELVIVCYNPANEDYTDNKTKVPKGALAKTLGDKFWKKPDLLKRLNHFYQLKQESTAQKVAEKLSSIFHASPRPTPQESTDAESSHDPPKEAVDMTETKTFGAVRAAMIQDLYDILPSRGFSVTVFNSCDKDELFICIALTDPEATKYNLTKAATKLQIQQRVVEALGVGQDASLITCSPPYVKYDPNLANAIAQSVDGKLGNPCDEVDFYHDYTSSGLHHEKTIMNSATRFRCIFKYLNHVISLDAAKRNKFIVGWFPAHTTAALDELKKRWARWSLLRDLQFGQPLNLINNYFGSRLAFIFAWNGCYCKLLIALAPIAILFEIANVLAISYGRNDYWNRRSLFGYGIVLAVWTRFASNLWNRQEQFMMSLWDLKGVLKDAQQRPEFFGEKSPNPVDTNLQTKVYPRWKFQLRQAMSWIVTSLFCLLDFICVMIWIDLWKGRLNPPASIVLAIIIQIFTQIFNVLAEVLTDAENHQFQLSYYNSYLLKMFFFQFINQYSAFFYIAIKQQFTTSGCPRIDMYDNDCVGLLNEQLPMTLVVLTFTRVVQVVLATVIVKLKFWWEDYQMRKKGLEVVPRCFLEEQAKFGPYRVREQIEATVQLALTLGYVLIFGTVSPRISLLSLIVFLVQLRAGAVQVCTAANRTMPRQAMGIGPLKPAMNLLAIIGVIFTGYLIVNFGPLFKGTMILTRVSALLVWFMLVAFLWFLVDFAISPDNSNVDILEARRAHVHKKITERKTAAMFGESGGYSKIKPQKPKGSTEYAKEVEEARWDDIPTLWELHLRKHPQDAEVTKA
jgi:hypothetical protein